METELERRAVAGRLRSTVITAGDFFGAGSGSWLDQAIIRPIAKGRLDYPGDPDLVHAWAYLPDLARAFVAVAALPDLAPFERFAFAGHSVTGRAFLAAVERAATSLGIASSRGWRHGRMSWPLLRAVGVVVPLWRELARMSYLWRVAHALDGHRLAACCPGLGATPLEDALRASLIALGPTGRYHGDRLPSGGTERCDWSPRATRPMRDGPSPCRRKWTAPARSCWRSRRPNSAPTRRRSRSLRRRFPRR
jgi:hypothetical protein